MASKGLFLQVSVRPNWILASNSSEALDNCGTALIELGELQLGLDPCPRAEPAADSETASAL
jgi:hypothetical protein